MNNYTIGITYTTGSELIDVVAISRTEAITKVMKTLEKKWKRYGCYNSVSCVTIVKVVASDIRS